MPPPPCISFRFVNGLYLVSLRFIIQPEQLDMLGDGEAAFDLLHNHKKTVFKDTFATLVSSPMK